MSFHETISGWRLPVCAPVVSTRDEAVANALRMCSTWRTLFFADVVKFKHSSRNVYAWCEYSAILIRGGRRVTHGANKAPRTNYAEAGLRFENADSVLLGDSR
ncbi:hypothetical protein IAQ61_003076 [Plenodomus lingam]|uniref:uncharacterized protein n=1 Tax=Leptosphaeria maculans TaxID=5022 RepID=UPI00331C59AC|nr:hypothetical protein IAQ61_003076 [Plenodomus lingam]